MEKQTLGLLIKARREHLGMTQQDVASKLNVARETLSNWETGRRGIDATEMPVLAKILKVPVSYFYGEEAYDHAADDSWPQVRAFYDDMTPDGQGDMIAMAEAIWKRKKREETTHGKKAE